MTISCRAPGKLIISGEHAVVYGRPALAMAVDRHAIATLTPNQSNEVVFSLPEFGATLRYTWDELNALRIAKLAAYDEFLAGQREITAVLPNPVELIPLAFAIGTEGNDMSSGVRIELSISIPIGCGMGSSAAVGLALIHAADSLAGNDPSGESLFEHSMVCERCMHGHPSGIDSYTCLHGGTVRFIGGSPEQCPTPSLPLSLLDTGRPESSTGECVVAVREKFGTSRIWDEFEQTSNTIHQGLSDDDVTGLLEPIRANHKLLCRIGVVPDRVREMIADIETQGGAAKVCGAGAVHGEHGGVVMVLGDIRMKEILKKYQVTALSCSTDSDGLTTT